MSSPDKAALRAEMRAVRKRLALENPNAAEDALRQLPALLETMFDTTQSFAEEQRTRRFVAAVYKAQGSELGAGPLARQLQSQDVDLALPVATAVHAPLEFRRWKLGDPLEPDISGVPAPLPLAEVVHPDVIFIPLLAVDHRGYRLGQGGGYYDRTLGTLKHSKPKPWFIGFCYSGQTIDRVPNETHDERLHGILTEQDSCTVWDK